MSCFQWNLRSYLHAQLSFQTIISEITGVRNVSLSSKAAPLGIRCSLNRVRHDSALLSTVWEEHFMLVENHLKQNNGRYLRETIRVSSLIPQIKSACSYSRQASINTTNRETELSLLRTHQISLSPPVTTACHSDFSSVWVTKQGELQVMLCPSINKFSVRTYYKRQLIMGFSKGHR